MEIKTERQAPKIESSGGNDTKKPDNLSEASFGKESSAVKNEALAKPSISEQLERKN
jgi:hypothetical protein